MTLPILVRNRATQDIRQQANYILSTGNRNAAERFLEAVESTFSQLAKTPNIGKIIQIIDLENIRQWRVKNFQDYLIFYKVETTQVDILRVLHGARDLDNILPFLDDEI